MSFHKDECKLIRWKIEVDEERILGRVKKEGGMYVHYLEDGEKEEITMKGYPAVRRDRNGWHAALGHSSNVERTIRIKGGNAYGLPKWKGIEKEEKMAPYIGCLIEKQKR